MKGDDVDLLSTLETLCESFLTLSRSLNTSSLASFDSHSPCCRAIKSFFHRLSQHMFQEN